MESRNRIVDTKSSFLFLEKSADGFSENSHGAAAISRIKDIRMLFTCSANVVGVTSKNAIHSRGFAANFFMFVKSFSEKITKKEQGIYFYIPCSTRGITTYVLTK